MNADTEHRQRLAVLFQAWSRWARTAPDPQDRGQAWQAEFPDWAALLDAAMAVMISGSADPEALRLLARCWAIDNSDGTLSTYARDHLDECWVAITAIARSPLSDARRQANEVLGAAGQRGEALLRAGINDPIWYCRRAALASLTPLKPPDAIALGSRFFNDVNVHVRRAAYQLAVCAQPTRMRFYTPEWFDGLYEDERFTAYFRHLDKVASALPPEALKLARCFVHDALVRGFRVEPDARLVTLQLSRCGMRDHDGLDLNLDIRYEAASVVENGVVPTVQLVLDPETNVLYQEVDCVAAGSFEHRMLLWPNGELIIRFGSLGLAIQPEDSAPDARS
jgi:hypothetical protein